MLFCFISIMTFPFRFFLMLYSFALMTRNLTAKDFLAKEFMTLLLLKNLKTVKFYLVDEEHSKVIEENSR